MTISEKFWVLHCIKQRSTESETEFFSSREEVLVCKSSQYCAVCDESGRITDNLLKPLNSIFIKCLTSSLYWSDLQMAHGWDKDSDLVDRFSHVCINMCVYKHTQNLAKIQAAKAFSAPELMCSLVFNFVTRNLHYKSVFVFGKYLLEI